MQNVHSLGLVYYYQPAPKHGQQVTKLYMYKQLKSCVLTYISPSIHCMQF